MIRIRNWLGILAMVLIFGMTVIGCPHDTKNENGAEINSAVWAQLEGRWEKGVFGDDDFRFLDFSITPMGHTVLLTNGQSIVHSLSENRMDIGIGLAIFNFVISNNGNTLTVSNWEGHTFGPANEVSNPGDMNGVYTKKTERAIMR